LLLFDLGTLSDCINAFHEFSILVFQALDPLLKIMLDSSVRLLKKTLFETIQFSFSFTHQRFQLVDSDLQLGVSVVLALKAFEL
jgi:hypothetical protein